MRFADKRHRQRQHPARNNAADKPPNRIAVMAELGKCNHRHAADSHNQAEDLQLVQPLVKQEKADGGKEKNLQTVEQGRNARADTVNAFVPQSQIDAECGTREQGIGKGGFAARQFLAETPCQKPKDQARNQQPPPCNGISTDGDEFDNQAAEAEDDAADHQQRGGIMIGWCGHGIFLRNIGAGADGHSSRSTGGRQTVLQQL